ncbi:MAG TPA: hypothetical protein DCS93_41255 [Microscillaceae bacterium]|nr:hypothetical protein [Microscillaceae bacterium]
MKKITLTQLVAQRLDLIAAYLLRQEETSKQNAYYIDEDIIVSGYIPQLRGLSSQAACELLGFVDLFATQFGIFDKRVVGNGEAIYSLNDLARNYVFSGGFVGLWKRQQENDKTTSGARSKTDMCSQFRQNRWSFLSVR